MFLHLLYPLARYHALRWLYVVRYASTRMIASTLTAMLMSFLLGPWFIRQLQSRQIGQTIREDGPQSHLSKAGTPTMGGSLILLALVVPTLLWCDLSNQLVWVVVGVTLGYGAIGFIDDSRKLRYKNSKGIPGKVKLIGQTLIGGAAVALMVWGNVFEKDVRHRLALPFADFNRRSLLLNPVVYFFFGLFVIVGSSNAVNLTDGLDGLAIGPVIVSGGTFLILSYAAGTALGQRRVLTAKARDLLEKLAVEMGEDAPRQLFSFNIAEYLKIPHIRGASELAIYCAAMVGSGVGFLWFNTHPASVFMGDVGSLALGGGLGTMAVLTKNEFVWALMGGVFVLEAVSVIVQVLSFKLTGKRVFRMAPIHHHFELKGWAEPKVIVRFWIISIMLALVALATLKLR